MKPKEGIWSRTLSMIFMFVFIIFYAEIVVVKNCHEHFQRQIKREIKRLVKDIYVDKRNKDNYTLLFDDKTTFIFACDIPCIRNEVAVGDSLLKEKNSDCYRLKRDGREIVCYVK